jgi:hypothetical protein
MCRKGEEGIGGKPSIAVARPRKRVAAVQCADMDGVRTGASITAAAERDTLLCSLKKTCSSSMVISRERDPNSTKSPLQRERRATRARTSGLAARITCGHRRCIANQTGVTTAHEAARSQPPCEPLQTHLEARRWRNGIRAGPALVQLPCAALHARPRGPTHRERALLSPARRRSCARLRRSQSSSHTT